MVPLVYFGARNSSPSSTRLLVSCTVVHLVNCRSEGESQRGQDSGGKCCKFLSRTVRRPRVHPQSPASIYEDGSRAADQQPEAKQHSSALAHSSKQQQLKRVINSYSTTVQFSTKYFDGRIVFCIIIGKAVHTEFPSFSSVSPSLPRDRAARCRLSSGSWNERPCDRISELLFSGLPLQGEERLLSISKAQVVTTVSARLGCGGLA